MPASVEGLVGKKGAGLLALVKLKGFFQGRLIKGKGWYELMKLFTSKYRFASIWLLLALFIFVILELVFVAEEKLLALVSTFGNNSRVYTSDYLESKNDPFAIVTNSNDRKLIKIDFYFKPIKSEGYQNLFQTSDYNKGLRAEFSGNVVALIFPMPGAADKIKGVQMANNIKLNEWYRFQLEALDEKFIKTKISGFQEYFTWRDHPEFKSDNIIAGLGFDGSRRFVGDIKNIKIEITPARNSKNCAIVVLLLKLILISLFIGSLYRGLPNDYILEKTPFVNLPCQYDPLLNLRAVACLMVLLGHAFMISLRPLNLENNISNGGWHWLFTSSPWVGVWIFFTLSGYLMGKGFFSGRYLPDWKGVQRFYRNRLLRIAPMYWFAIFFVFALIMPYTFNLHNIDSILRLFLFDNDGQTGLVPIGALWSISTEMQYYLVVPLVFVLFKKKIDNNYFNFFFILCILTIGLCYRFFMIKVFGWDIWPREVYKTFIGNFDLFLCGFLLNPFLVKIKGVYKGGKFGIYYGFLLLSLLYLGSSWVSSRGMVVDISFWKHFLFVYTPTLIAVGTSLIIACLELGKYDHLSPFFVKIVTKLEFFGIITYALYVWHEPIYLAYSKSMGPVPTLMVSFKHFIYVIFLVLVVAIASYFLVEKPFEKKKVFTASIS